MRAAWLLVSSLIAVLVLAIACGDNGGPAGDIFIGSPNDPEATAADGGDDGAPEDLSPEPTPDEAETALRAEAAGFCPEEFLYECTESYIRFAARPEKAALCVNAKGEWYFEEPNGAVGDACSVRESVIVVIVGGEQ